MTQHGVSRRVFSVLGLGVIAGAAWPAGARAQGPGINPPKRDTMWNWEEIAPGVRLAAGQGGNTILITSQDQAVFVDTKNPGYGPSLRREGAAHAPRVALVINTHHHRDHIGGNTAFRDVPIIAHPGAKQRILDGIDATITAVKTSVKDLDRAPFPIPAQVRQEVLAFEAGLADLKPDDFLPTRDMEGQAQSLRVGALEIELHAVGPAHTDNDVAVWIPALNLLHTGDLVFHKNHPFLDRAAGGNTRAWQASLDRLATLCDDKTIVVPGHGSHGGADILALQSQYFNDMREAVREARDARGFTKAEVLGLRPAKYVDYGFQRMLQGTLLGIFDELESERSTPSAPPAQAPAP